VKKPIDNEGSSFILLSLQHRDIYFPFYSRWKKYIFFIYLGENMIEGKEKWEKGEKKEKKRGEKRERNYYGEELRQILILISILYLYFPPMFMIFWREKIYTPVITL